MDEDSSSHSKLSLHQQAGNWDLIKASSIRTSMSDSGLSSETSIFHASQTSDSSYIPPANWDKKWYKELIDLPTPRVFQDDPGFEWRGGLREVPTVPKTESTVTTRRTTATIVSNCTTDPMANLDYRMRRESARADLKGRLEVSPNLVEDFFGLDAILRKMPPPEDFIAENYSKGRWNNLPPDMTKESDLNNNFLGLLNGIQQYYFEGEGAPKRHFIDTHSSPIKVDGQSDRYLQPDVSFCGKGHSLPKKIPEFSPISKIMDWKWILAALDGKIDRTHRRKDDHYQLASYIREVFSAQDNRRFIPGFIFTQSILDFYHFDRSGFALCASFDYHAQPRKFMAIVYSLLKFDEERLGFDSSIVHENQQQYITTRVQDATGSQSTQRYIVDGKLWHSTALVGDCTVCWRVKKEDVDDGYYIIKDSWVVGGSSNEGSLLERVGSKELNGLIPIVSHENVLMTTGCVDCISNIRPPRDDLDTTTPPEDRVHTRVVMRLDGKARPLEFFRDPAELLIALHDAIEGHRNLYEHGILCRDVTPFNILIQPDAPKGRRGILFNLHCAVGTQSIPSIGPDDYIEHLLPASLPDTLGSRAFQSCRTLAVFEDLAESPNGIVGKNHYTDDLESFYYVLRYLVALFPAPGLVKFDIRHSRWFTDVGFGTKYGDYAKPTLQFTVTERFGEPVRSLLQQFHTFLRPTSSVVPPSSWRPVGLRDYNKVLGLFRDAIERFPGEKGQDNDPHTTQIIPLARISDGPESHLGEPLPKRQKCDSYGTSIADRVKLRKRC